MKKNILILILTIAIPVLSFANDGWTLLNSNITHTINSLYFTDVNTGYAVANSGTIIKTSNSGSSWSPVSSGLTVDLQKVYFTSSSVGYILSEKGQILSTQTSGASWTSNTIYDFSLNGISFYGSKGIVVGDAGFVSTTVDGTTWTNQNILGVYTVNDVLLLNDTLAVAVGANGTIFRSGDAGVSWTSVVSGTENSLSAIEKNGTQNTMIVGENGTIIHYNPFTKVVSDKSIVGLTSWLKDVNYSTPEKYYTAGFNSTFLMYNGSAWTKKTIDSTENFNTVFFVNEYIGFMAGLDGAIYKSETGGFAINTIEVEKQTISVFPNPAKNSINFNFSTSSQSSSQSFQNGILKTYNSIGELVMEVIATNSNFTIDISSLNSGLYYYTYQTQTERLSGKFIKL